MKRFLRTFFLAAPFFGIYWGLWEFYVTEKDLSSAVWSGVIMSVFAGFVAAIAARYMENRVSDSPPVLTEEVLLRNGRADHDGMRGWLYLTDRRILFEGYLTDKTAPEITTLFERFPTDASSHDLSIPILQVAKVAVGSPLGIDSRLDIVLTDGDTKHFGIEDPTDWIDDITIARQKCLDEPRSENMKLFP
jgi:hypothetical protein